ncbi:MAG: hypothetical protein WAQ27_05955 [Candidatus Microsaccharimonas sp.]
MLDSTEIAPSTWYSSETGMVMYSLGDQVGDVEPLRYSGVDLFPKTEYHTTLVSVRRDIPEPALEAVFVDALSNFLADNPVAVAELGAERYFCTKNEEATVVAPVHVIGERALRAFVQTFIPDYDPFFHVTLLKNSQTKYGIRISSAEDLAERCVQI